MNLENTIKISALLLTTSLLACNGGEKNYTQTLDDTSGENSAMTGSTLVSASDGTLAISSAKGTLDHSTQVISNANGTPITKEKLNGNYDYVTMYNQTYNGNQASGILGISTNDSDMPSSSTATYRGDSRAYYAGGAIGVDLSGTSTVVADFENDKVTTTLTNFTNSSNFDLELGYSPFDTITLDSIISGNKFTGTSLTTTYDGEVVNGTGANTTTNIEGNFFGFNETLNIPDEVGGVFVSKGDEGLLTGKFVGD